MASVNGYGAFKEGWFTELSPDAEMWPGQAMSIEVAPPSPRHLLAARVALFIPHWHTRMLHGRA